MVPQRPARLVKALREHVTLHRAAGLGRAVSFVRRTASWERGPLVKSHLHRGGTAPTVVIAVGRAGRCHRKGDTEVLVAGQAHFHRDEVPRGERLEVGVLDPDREFPVEDAVVLRGLQHPLIHP